MYPSTHRSSFSSNPADVVTHTKQHTFKGLAILLIDYLASPRVDGYADEVMIAADLRLSQKNIRKALRYLEGEHILASESVKFAFKRKNIEEPDDPEIEERKRRETHVFWCVDYPRFVDVLRLKLHRMRDILKHQVEGADALQRYICPRCGAQYSSLDAMSLLDVATGAFLCEECQGELQEHIEGPAGAAAAGTSKGANAASTTTSRRERQTYFKDLLARVEGQLKPMAEQLEKLKDVPPPDYGPLQDWYNARREEAARRAKRLEAARKKMAEGGVGAADLTDEQLLEWAERAEVVVALPGQGGGMGGQEELQQQQQAKELPAWFRRSEDDGNRGGGGGAAGAGAGTMTVKSLSVEEERRVGTGGGGGVQGRKEVAVEEEERRRLEQQYLEQYLAQVRNQSQQQQQGQQQGNGVVMKKEEEVVMKTEGILTVGKKEEAEGDVVWEDAGGGDVDWEDA